MVVDHNFWVAHIFVHILRILWPCSQRIPPKAALPFFGNVASQAAETLEPGALEDLWDATLRRLPHSATFRAVLWGRAFPH